MAFSTVPGTTSTDATSLIGTAGIDTVVLSDFSTTIWLGAQGSGDQIGFTAAGGTVSSVSIRGGQGSDRVYASTNQSTLEDSFINLNADADVLAIAGATAATIFGGSGGDTLATGSLRSTRLNGNKGNDTTTISGATGSSIFGGQGNDSTTLNGDYTSSVVQGDNDDDILILSAGSSFGNSTINGNSGNDLITINAVSGFSSSTTFGGQGTDTINATNAAVGITASGDAGNDTLLGSAFADTLYAGIGNDTIDSGNGNDVLVSTGGTDQLTGGAGNDTYSVTNGLNTVILDFVGLADNNNALVTNGGSVRAIVDQGATFVATAATSNTGAAVELDMITLGGITTVDMSLASGTTGYFINIGRIGGSGNTTGSNSADTISGFNGADTLNGGGGRDQLSGGASNDTLNGGAEADQIFTRFTDADVVQYSAGTVGESETFSGTLSDGDVDILDGFNRAAGMKIIGFGVNGAGQFGTTTGGSNYASYADALAGANVAIAATDNDYILSAYGSGGNWTAVLFIDIGATGGGGAAAGAIQIDGTGDFGSEAAALSALLAGDILA